MIALINCPICGSTFSGEENDEGLTSLQTETYAQHDAEKSLHTHASLFHDDDAIEKHVRTKYGVDIYDFEFDPAGDLCFYVGSEIYDSPNASDAVLIRLWDERTPGELRRQSDEPPSFDDALGEVCDANERMEEARKMKQ